MIDIEKALEQKKDESLTYQARVQCLILALKECGYPLTAERLENSLLLGDEESGEAVIVEIEGLLEVLTGDDGHYHH